MLDIRDQIDSTSNQNNELSTNYPADLRRVQLDVDQSPKGGLADRCGGDADYVIVAFPGRGESQDPFHLGTLLDYLDL